MAPHTYLSGNMWRVKKLFKVTRFTCRLPSDADAAASHGNGGGQQEGLGQQREEDPGHPAETQRREQPHPTPLHHGLSTQVGTRTHTHLYNVAL